MRALALFVIGAAFVASHANAQDNPAEAPAEAPPVVDAPAPPAEVPPAAPPPAVSPPPVYSAPAAPPVYSAPAAPPSAVFTPAPAQLQPNASPGYGYGAYAAPQPVPLPPPSWAPRAPQAPPAPYYIQVQPAPVAPPPPSPYVLPPLPPGYVYMPVPTSQPQGASLEQINAELARVDAQLAALQQDRIHVGGPITLMVLGFGTTLVAGITGLSYFAAAESIQHRDYDPYDNDELDYNNDGKINGHDAHDFRRGARISAAVAGVGLLFGTIGAFRLSHKRELRRQRAQEIKTLSQQRNNLRSQLHIAPTYAPGQYGIGVQGQF